jgi:hypothetical protein
MRPGRELDAMVAARVLGERPTLRRTLPAFSTDTACAWVLVKFLKTQGWCWSGEQTPEYVSFTFHKKGTDTQVSAQGETEAHAICLAALKATA